MYMVIQRTQSTEDFSPGPRTTIVMQLSNYVHVLDSVRISKCVYSIRFRQSQNHGQHRHQQ